MAPARLARGFAALRDKWRGAFLIVNANDPRKSTHK